MSLWKCEICKRETTISFRCDNCHRGVCHNCIVFRGDKQLCVDCAHPIEGVRIDEPRELVPA